MFLFIDRIFLLVLFIADRNDGFLWNRPLPPHPNPVSIPYDSRPGVSDKHPQFPIEFLSSNIHWEEEYPLISQYFPTKTREERDRNPLHWYAFDQRKLIGLIYAYGKGLPSSQQIRDRQRSSFLTTNRSSQFRSRSSSLNFFRRTPRIRFINPRFIHLSLLIVHRDYHQLNIGSRLLQRIETYCEDFQCQHLELVPIPDRKVKEFYRKRGYRENPIGHPRGFWIKYFQRKARPRSDLYPYRPL